MKNWKTTLVGFLGGIGIIATQLYHLLDGNDSTTFSGEMFIAGLAMMGLGWVAGDKPQE